MSYLDDAGIAYELLVSNDGTLSMVDRYLHGHHDDPYIPKDATEEYKLLVKRAVTNWVPMVVSAPAETLYVEGYRHSVEASDDEEDASSNTAWDAWQRSGMDSRQLAIHRSAIAYGSAYTVVDHNDVGEAIIRGLSPLNTITLYRNPGYDLEPYGALYVAHRPRSATDGLDEQLDLDPQGLAYYWDDKNRYTLRWDSGTGFQLSAVEEHGSDRVPVTRFSPHLDLNGRSMGVVEELKPLQDRFNQTVFDLLIAQTFTSFAVRTVSGMEPPVVMMRNSDGELVPKLDENNNPLVDKVRVNASKWIWSSNADAKFGTLPAGDLSGFIDACDMDLRHIASTTGVPPHFLLGQVANLSAEALQSAELALSRKSEEFRHSFGESWERTLRLASELAGDVTGAADDHAEVIWRDMHNAALSQTADGLSKIVEGLQVPAEGVWDMIPGVDPGKLAKWKELAKQADVTNSALTNAFGSSQSPSPSYDDDSQGWGMHRQDVTANGSNSTN